MPFQLQNRRLENRKTYKNRKTHKNHRETSIKRRRLGERCEKRCQGVFIQTTRRKARPPPGSSILAGTRGLLTHVSCVGTSRRTFDTMYDSLQEGRTLLHWVFEVKLSSRNDFQSRRFYYHRVCESGGKKGNHVWHIPRNSRRASRVC